jgi:hypothetical protein
LGIENRKSKIVNFFSLSKPAPTIKKKLIFNFFNFLIFASMRTAEGREGEGGGEGRGGEGRGGV